MVLFNYAIREITAKIVYYGPGLCGKTTNLQWIHEQLDPSSRGKLLSLATDGDRTLFFDFLPIEMGNIGGYKVRFQLYTVPGQVHYNATRKLVLKGVDAVVFVADSQVTMLERNRESYENLIENLADNGYNPAEVPIVIQLNKRDLPDIGTPEELLGAMGVVGRPVIEAVASRGDGVFETLKADVKLTLARLRTQFAAGDAPSLEPEAAPPEAPSPPSASVFGLADTAPAPPTGEEIEEYDLDTLAEERATAPGDTPAEAAAGEVVDLGAEHALDAEDDLPAGDADDAEARRAFFEEFAGIGGAEPRGGPAAALTPPEAGVLEPEQIGAEAMEFDDLDFGEEPPDAAGAPDLEPPAPAPTPAGETEPAWAAPLRNEVASLREENRALRAALRRLAESFDRQIAALREARAAIGEAAGGTDRDEGGEA